MNDSPLFTTTIIGGRFSRMVLSIEEGVGRRGGAKVERGGCDEKRKGKKRQRNARDDKTSLERCQKVALFTCVLEKCDRCTPTACMLFVFHCQDVFFFVLRHQIQQPNFFRSSVYYNNTNGPQPPSPGPCQRQVRNALRAAEKPLGNPTVTLICAVLLPSQARVQVSHQCHPPCVLLATTSHWDQAKAARPRRSWPTPLPASAVPAFPPLFSPSIIRLTKPLHSPFYPAFGLFPSFIVSRFVRFWAFFGIPFAFFPTLASRPALALLSGSKLGFLVHAVTTRPARVLLVQPQTQQRQIPTAASINSRFTKSTRSALPSCRDPSSHCLLAFPFCC